MDYVQLLKDHHVKITHQRLAILEYLDKHRIHPTAEEIYHALKSTNPALSLTTVYNTVEMLRTEGIIQSFSLCGNQMRFDFDKTGHCHFICTSCGEIFDMDIDLDLTSPDRLPSTPHRIDRVQVVFRGVCDSCLAKEYKKAEQLTPPQGNEEER